MKGVHDLLLEGVVELPACHEGVHDVLLEGVVKLPVCGHDESI